MKQYIDFYNENQKVLSENSHPILNALREKALADFAVLGFDAKNKGSYRTDALKKAYEHNYGMNLKRLSIPIDLKQNFRCDVPGITDWTFYIVNDRFLNNEKKTLPQGVIACSMLEAAQKYPELVKKYYGKQIDTSSDGTMAFNMIFSQDGFFLYVPENVMLDKPIQLVNIMHGSIDIMANSHNLIILEKNSQAKLLVCDHAIEQQHFLSNRITEVFVGVHAVYDHYKVESTHSKTINICSLFIEQEDASNTVTNIITLNNGLTHNNIQIKLNGKQAQTVLAGMAIENETQTVNNSTFIHHAVPQCSSKETFKYILDNQSKGSFLGRILVAPNAQQTEAYQTNRNICLTPEAKMYTKPQLEIYADDVKCGHGATIGQLDESALFYMRSRGISAKTARLMLMMAFVDDVIEHIRVEKLKDRIRLLVETRLHGEGHRCNGCKICK